MNSKTRPFLQKCSANPLMQMHAVCLSACTTGPLLVWLLCEKYFAELRIQQSQQTRNQSSKARARAGVIKARGVSTGEGERLLSPPLPHAPPLSTRTPPMLMQLCDSLTKIPMNKIPRMLLLTTLTPRSGP